MPGVPRVGAPTPVKPIGRPVSTALPSASVMVAPCSVHTVTDVPGGTTVIGDAPAISGSEPWPDRMFGLTLRHAWNDVLTSPRSLLNAAWAAGPITNLPRPQPARPNT